MMALIVAATVISMMPRLVGREVDIRFPEPGRTEVINLTDFNPGSVFREVIPSWNVKNAGNAKLTVEMRGIQNGTPTAWYRMADWSLAATGPDRQSIKNKEDADGEVQTDTLSFKKAMNSVEVRLTLTGGDNELATLDLVALSFSGQIGDDPALSKPSSAWGRNINVVKRCQGDYPNGSVLCSATSTSMLLAEASSRIGMPVDRDVPDVVNGLWDSAYEGAGNWSFNAAYYGQFAGLRGYVSRFSSIAELEEFILAGIPVAVSVDYNRLKGTPKPTESGHLVVLVGFTKSGDPIFNDPAVKTEVRTTYKRADFDSGWRRSGRTVYVFTPKNAPIPASFGRWMDKQP